MCVYAAYKESFEVSNRRLYVHTHCIPYTCTLQLVISKKDTRFLCWRLSVISDHVTSEEVCDEEETGSPRWLTVPTRLHDPHHHLRGVAGSSHGVPTGHFPHHLLIAQGRVGVEFVWVEHLPL